MRTRDDFRPEVKDLLAKRVGMRCSNPNCRQVTSGPQEDPHKVLNIGVAAHITAAAAKGPRYDKTLTQDGRRSPDNGIWLCQNCGKLVDNDAKRTQRSCCGSGNGFQRRPPGWISNPQVNRRARK